MRLRSVAIWLAVALALLLSACRDEPQPEFTTSDEPRPALWLVTAPDGDGQAYLFGTIHLLPSGIDWQDGRIEQALRASDMLVVEVAELDDREKMSETFSLLAFQPVEPRPPLLQRLPADLRDEGSELVTSGGLDLAMLDRMDSWAAALQISSTLHGELGLDENEGVERRLTERFAAFGKPVVGLETIAGQLSIFDRLPEALQCRMLAEVVEEADEGAVRFQQLLDAWLSGSESRMQAFSDDGLMADPLLRELLLERRNRKWSDDIARRLDKGERMFVAVGAAHLVGQDGLPSLLSARGYDVRRVE